jgi:hypothetical protein
MIKNRRKKKEAQLPFTGESLPSSTGSAVYALPVVSPVGTFMSETVSALIPVGA